ncbi:SRPBCC family protein [Kordiimonas aestuarii]|uniref:SRPBCC family protein n=1 Tax=Kordiimonas aestuarii TaxID=1005925 RepID=UPI0021D315D1|nr:SRPBCC family protein [Kordiimonas aestuarii]
MTATNDNNLDLVIDRTLPVPVDLVWQAWSDVTLFQQWWAPRPVTLKVEEMDLRPGGGFRAEMNLPDGTVFPLAGCYLAVEEKKRIVFTDALTGGWRPAAEPFFSAVITMEDLGDSTRYIATAMHNNVESRKRHEEMGFFDGWGTCIDQLVELATSLK